MDDIYRRIASDDDWGPDDTGKSEIQEFFKGQTVLLTGCTGFLGKCFVEKLLRGCPGINKLYLIVRSLKVSPQERINKYFQHYYFDRLRRERPNFLSKVQIIEGNLLEENLGISDENKQIIENNVTIIIHNASNVKFEARLSEFLRCNVLGTKYMTEMAKGCKNLKCFVYISTAYSHCYRQEIEEKCYPPPANMKMVHDLIEADELVPNGLSNDAKMGIISPWPNTYTFTKSTAESIVEQLAKDVPFACVIYRPSIVLSTYQEPIPVWCGNINGPAALFVGGGLGVVHAIPGQDVTQDYVPADMCTNALLATIWDVMTSRKENIGSIMVFNYGTSSVNATSVARFTRHIESYGRERRSIWTVGPYFFGMITCVYWFAILHFIFHFIPALLADIVLLLMFRKPQALWVFWKATINLHWIRYFAIGNWKIRIPETIKVWDRMNDRDRHLFFCDLRKLDWALYGYAFYSGLRVYILKDPLTTLERARRKFNMIDRIYETLRVLAIMAVVLYALSFLAPIVNYVMLKICQPNGCFAG